MASFGILGGRVRARWLSAVALCAAAVSAPALASTFNELPDAGETVATAQIAFGPAPLESIQGTLAASLDQADLFVINIVSTSDFSATTAGTSLDTQLFLFALDGTPVYMNDDETSGLSLSSELPASSLLGPKVAGQYLLAVALAGYDPVNSVNQLLFEPGSTTNVRGPANGLQPAQLASFSESFVFDESGNYDIQLTGASGVSAPIPEPSSALLLLLGLAAFGWLSKSRRGASNGHRAA